MAMTFPAPYTAEGGVLAALRDEGYAVLSPAMVAAMAGVAPADIAGLQVGWDDLPLDGYLRDGGSYRRRRHSCFLVDEAGTRPAPHRAHWQSLDYNALHGGMERWFEPVAPAVVAQPVWSKLLLSLAQVFSARMPVPRWFVEAHQFRIDTADGLGRPTPEGAHRDGVDFVAVMLIARAGIKGGETRVFEANGPDGQRFTLDAPWSLLLLDDARMIHESTPIQPVGEYGHRDTLVLTYRAAGFQGDA